MDPKEAHRELWKKYVAEWESSGKSCKQWTKDNNLSYHSLLYWRQKYAKTSPTPPTAQKTFIELQDQAPASCGVVLEIAGVMVRLEQSFDPATLTACIQLLKKL